mmetsp:Transcript_37899/g.80669  ORF Transcript_37899/g.80669 Transcript_37899/m.80669 type:complete len:153 (-) Transcript_37899:72-530(-)
MVERITFRNNEVFNTTGFIRLETAYQSRGAPKMPRDYPPTVVRDISWINNTYGPATRRTGAKWLCSPNTTCEAITVVDNTMPPRGKWQCTHVRAFNVSGNVPNGLPDCMQNSALKPARTRAKRAKWRKFHWAGTENGGAGGGAHSELVTVEL